MAAKTERFNISKHPFYKVKEPTQMKQLSPYDGLRYKINKSTFEFERHLDYPLIKKKD